MDSLDFKRPSTITILLGVGIVALIVVIVILCINIFSSKNVSKEVEMNKIESIAGDENVLLDEEGNKINSSNSTLGAKEVDGFIFDSFEISTNSGITTVSFEIYNPDDEDRFLGEYELKVLGEDGSIVGRITDNAGTIEGLVRKDVTLQLKGDISNLSEVRVNKIVYQQM